MIFQDALSALNPVFTVGYQLGELFRVHRGMSRKDAKARAIELLDLVKIPAARQRVKDYPHQFSGGMRQRVMIAMALALDPDVLIADEPTTALDVTVQAQIMDLLGRAARRAQHGADPDHPRHGRGRGRRRPDRGDVRRPRSSSTPPVHDIYARPAHPYTKALLESIPRLDRKGQELAAISGLPPELTDIPPGCPFHPRCPYPRDVCRHGRRRRRESWSRRQHTSACHFWKEVPRRLS